MFQGGFMGASAGPIKVASKVASVASSAMSPLMLGSLISGGAQLLGGIFGMASAKRAQRAAQDKANRLSKELTTLEENRQAITNPYEGVVDLSGSLSNPYDGLAVATQAAELQIEQADISLANTLDTIRATGSSAGGATALAQAALRSKQGVSASIEKQEANNEQLRAQGEATLQTLKMSEKARVQDAQAKGEISMFSTRENREVAELNRTSNQLDQARNAATQAGADSMGAFTGMIGGLASTAGNYGTTSSKDGNYDNEGYKNT